MCHVKLLIVFVWYEGYFVTLDYSIQFKEMLINIVSSSRSCAILLVTSNPRCSIAMFAVRLLHRCSATLLAFL